MNRVAALVGPTASGKSQVAVQAALVCGGEVLSCDSVQVYRGMDIGSGKIRPEERRGVVHHLLDIASPLEEYTVARYQQDARRLIREVNDRGRLPLLCGGTGLYLRAALDDYTFTEEEGSEPLREALRERLVREGSEALHRELATVDPESAGRLHPKDGVRVLRALEVYRLTGMPIGERHRARRESLFETMIFGLEVDRGLLYERIEQRVDAMIVGGLENETRALLAAGVSPNAKAMQTLGYRHMVQVIRGELDLERAVSLMKRDTRRYAKRQLTWFRRDPRIHWLTANTDEELQKAAWTIGEALSKFKSAVR